MKINALQSKNYNTTMGRGRKGSPEGAVLSLLLSSLRTCRHFKGIALEVTKLGGENQEKQILVYKRIAVQARVRSQTMDACLPLPAFSCRLPHGRAPHPTHSHTLPIPTWHQVCSEAFPAEPCPGSCTQPSLRRAGSWQRLLSVWSSPQR